MFNYSWEPLLSKYFSTLLKGENQCEIIRQDLALTANFEINQVFNFLDRDSKSFISLNDLKDFLDENSVVYSEQSLRKFIHNYDRDRDFAINFNEFSNIILSRKNSSLNRQSNEKKNSNIPSVVIQTLIRVLRAELDLVEELSTISDEMKFSKDFTSYEAFTSIDLNNSKYITGSSLVQFMRRVQVNLSEREAEDIIFRLDSDEDGRVSYEEFQEIFYSIKVAGVVYTSPTRTKIESNSLSYSATNFNATEKKSGTKSYDEFDFKRSCDGDKWVSPVRSPAKQVEKEYSSDKNYSTLKTQNTYKTTYNVSKSPVDLRAHLNTYTSPIRRNELNHSYLSKNVDEGRLNFSPTTSTRTCHICLKSPIRISKSPVGKLYSNNYSRYESPSNIVNKLKSNNLAGFLNDLIKSDSMVEVHRENLALKTDTSLRDIFCYFDLSERSSVSLIDFKEVLKELDIFSTMDEVKLVFKRYDSDLDGRLSFEEMSEMLLPKNPEYAKYFKRRYPISHVVNLNYEARSVLNKLFRALITGEIECEGKRKMINSDIGFSTYESFGLIKEKFSTSITKNDLYNFLHENAFYVTTSELDCLFERLDKNGDGRISFNEFLNEVIPRHKLIF